MALFQPLRVFTVIFLLGLANGFRQVQLSLVGHTIQAQGLPLLQPGCDAEPSLALGTDETGSITNHLVNGLENHTIFASKIKRISQVFFQLNSNQLLSLLTQ